jgi:hypothetical protein
MPLEIARKPAQRQVQTVESKNQHTGNNQKKAKKDEGAAKISHKKSDLSGRRQQRSGFAQQF